jgi:hypothetical protein
MRIALWIEGERRASRPEIEAIDDPHRINVTSHPREHDGGESLKEESPPVRSSEAG